MATAKESHVVERSAIDSRPRPMTSRLVRLAAAVTAVVAAIGLAGCGPTADVVAADVPVPALPSATPAPTPAPALAPDPWSQPGEPPTTPEEFAQANSKAFALAHEIGNLAEEGLYGDPTHSGYSGMETDVGAERIDLWWKGDLPRAVRRLVESGRKRGITVVVHPVTRSRAEMTRCTDKILRSPELRRAGIEPTSIGVGRETYHLSFRTDRPDKAVAAADAERIARRICDVPVEAQEGGKIVGA
jgi:hypothetical protein